jgi:hypothetical protein
MKKNLKKLSLNRETLRSLDIVGGAVAITSPVQLPQQPQPFTTSQTISICKYCTTPLDGCPPVTQTVA